MKILTLLKFWKWQKRYYLLIIILTLIGVGYYFYIQSKKPAEPIQTLEVKRGDIKSTISSSGTLTGKNQASLKFKVGGKLGYLNVKAGDNVEEGQVVAGLDTHDLSIRLRQAELNYISKDATAKQVEDEVKDHDKDETFEQREERIIAQTARDSAFDSLKEARRAFQDVTLYSPISGTVIETNFLPGQNVSVADIITQIVDQSETYFDAEVDEADIGKIAIGQTAQITLNSYEDQTFEGTVSEIKPYTKENSSGATVVIVRINLGKPNLNFVSGLNGQSEIIFKTSTNTLIIPQEALINENTVTVKSNNTFNEVKVKTGISSDTEIEILEGLQEGQQVVTNPQAIKK